MQFMDGESSDVSVSKSKFSYRIKIIDKNTSINSILSSHGLVYVGHSNGMTIFNLKAFMLGDFKELININGKILDL
jgi:hypothetical protein